MDTDALFAKGLRAMRERMGKSQQWVATEMSERGYDWHQSTVYKSEAGNRKVSIGEAAHLAAVLNVTVDDLLSWEGVDQERDDRWLFTLADNFVGSLLKLDDIARDAYKEQKALEFAAFELDSRGFKPRLTGGNETATQSVQPFLDVDEHKRLLVDLIARFENSAFQALAGDTRGVVGLGPLPWDAVDG